MKWYCRTCRSRQRRPPTDYKMFDDATPATRPSSTIYENSCGGDHCDDDDWWCQWWYWRWLVSLETTNFWLLLRSEKNVFLCMYLAISSLSANSGTTRTTTWTCTQSSSPLCPPPTRSCSSREFLRHPTQHFQRSRNDCLLRLLCIDRIWEAASHYISCLNQPYLVICS